MKKRRNPFSAALAAGGVAAALAISTAGAATVEPALPLTGPAFELAQAAYKAYARGDFRVAANNAREALRLRPDVVQLKPLLRKAEAAQLRSAHRTTPAQHPPARAAPLETAPSQVTTSAAAPAAIAADPAFLAADSGYRAYAAGDYSAAAAEAQRAVQIAPSKRQYWLLLGNALSAGNRLAEAERALAQGIEQAGDDGTLGTRRAEIARRIADARSFELAATAYKAIDAGNFSLAASSAREAVELSPANRDYALLLVNALLRGEHYEEAEQAAGAALARDGGGKSASALLAQRGLARRRMGREIAAREDFDAALKTGDVPLAQQVALLADLDRKSEARTLFDSAKAKDGLSALTETDRAYLAARVGDDDEALAAFTRAVTAGTLPGSAYEDAAFSAVRAGEDAKGIAYFKRSIDRTDTLKLRIDPQLRFNTRRAVAEVSRTTGVIASLTYRGAVSGLGVTPGGGDNLQAGVEAYWRPWGYRNSRYIEVFVRAFETLYSKDGGGTGADTIQSALGIRYKMFRDINLVASGSRVFSRSGRRQDWLAQLGYSSGNGADLRVDTPAWWTTRLAAEAGRYVEARTTYALAHVEAGRSIHADGIDGKWVLFPHVSVAADYDSTANEAYALGIGPGFGARYWFREDVYNAPRSYFDLLLGYRFGVAGAERARGAFVTTTLSY